ncbi:hypothetical protein [Geoglobus ahangari]
MKVRARVYIKLSDIIKLLNTGTSWESKAKLLEAYGFDSKFRITARNLAKDKRLKKAIFEQLRRLSSKGEIK